ncbi:hypothetical protein PUN28_005229 [Cardiocondyla obscurior]|uniref:Uncharacterized protein n=1 Tax=Cardiocondyla obscurior TaxID=286306 RepID=A0AAW2GIT0_9HYME
MQRLLKLTYVVRLLESLGFRRWGITKRMWQITYTPCSVEKCPCTLLHWVCPRRWLRLPDRSQIYPLLLLFEHPAYKHI